MSITCIMKVFLRSICYGQGFLGKNKGVVVVVCGGQKTGLRKGKEAGKSRHFQ